ncbi:disease resistance protein RPM1 [Vigna unguiculata]|uniref:Disease resistance protein RPM1 n=1 Tax=Vigna unguiculata TaxID=3917 RepID=A0A4D6N1Y4_VIGUN|nr:disease resistance protein RPM1 [Vigna unguiculata]
MTGRCCPFQQHVMELNFMEQMEHINNQFGYALSSRRTFEDGGKIVTFGDGWKPVMEDIIGSRSEPLTSTCFQLFESLWRCLDHNLNTVRRYLAIIKVFLNDIDGAAEDVNQRQKVWVEQLRMVAREGHSIVDAYPDKDGLFFFLRRIIFAKNIDRLLKEIINISKRKEIYGIANIHIRERQSVLEGDNLGLKLVAQPDSCSHRHITEFEKEFQLIKGEKQLMNALFDDLQEIGYEKLDERYKIWVDQMKEIVPELDLVIKECACELKHVTLLNNILGFKARIHIMDKIKKIRKKIEDAGRGRKACSLVQRQSQAESLCRKTQPLLIAKESRMVGFDEDVEILMAQLLSDEKHRCICSIVGTKGTGKTELASFIYRSEAVLSHFDCVIWVTPSSTVEPLKNQIAKKAAEIIMGGEHDMWTTQVVLTTLATKKYLIVVDGFQTAHALDNLREAIPDRLTASRFLLTTNNAMEALRACSKSFFVHPLRLLDDKNSWILLTRELNVKMNLEPKLHENEIEEIGKKIMAKCGGLPLEIQKKSKLLFHKDVTAEEWAKVLEQPNEDQNTWSETFDTVNNLPSYLRRCLFYFELFPADFEIPVRRLVALWVAEGFVPLGEDQEWPPELVAERYLIELIDLNMVQIAKRKRNGKVKTCRFPNGLRQIFKSTESRIPQVGGTSTDLEAVPKNFRIRRVADHLEVKDIWHKHIHGKRFTYASDCDSLRTYYQSVSSFLSFDTRLASKSGHDIRNFLQHCILNNCLLQLRVLVLEGVYKPNLPKDIAKLSRLRYLGLRWTYLELLSPYINSLLQLQTLDLKHTYIQTLPRSIWKMKLRHLSLSESNRITFPPKPIGIDIGRSLHDLQTLWGVFVDEETPVKGGLDKLVNITKLGITCHSQVSAVADWIAKLQYLQSLRLRSRDKQGRPSKIHLKFLQHHTNLTDLYLFGCLNTPLNQLFLPSTLVVLTLSHSKLEDDPMQILKDAPNLRSLSLFADSYLGQRIVCESDSFSQLRVLRVWKLEQLEEWKIEEKALPSLRQLEIRLCPRMKVLPDGLNHVNSLLELKLTNMPMEIHAEKYNIPPNCEVHRDDSPLL